jgi:hypothetical protein
MLISTEEKLLREQCKLLHAEAFISYVHSKLRRNPLVNEDTRDECISMLHGYLKHPPAFRAPYEHYDKTRLQYIFEGFHEEDLTWRSIAPQHEIDEACRMELRRRRGE